MLRTPVATPASGAVWHRSRKKLGAAAASLLWILLNTSSLKADDLEQNLGRRDVRIYSAPFVIAPGGDIWGYALGDRLDRLGYHRVHRKPERSGEYFWGDENFWIFRRSFRHGGRQHPEILFGLRLDPRGRILQSFDEDGATTGELRLLLEPETLGESLSELRAPRVLLRLADLPEGVWRPVLAAEDARFFDHIGLDGKSLARALLANLKAGRVTQGGSTITQQLIKNRDLSPRRTLGRKASEAIRALTLEAEYDKKDILQAYLNQVYFGHYDQLAIHGFATAARLYFSKTAAELDLAEAATLAAMIQGPNRLSPVRHPDRVEERRNWVLSRLEELGWASPEAVRRAREKPVWARLTPPARPLAPHFLGWIESQVAADHSRRLDKGRGFVAETTLDPWLQHLAQQQVNDHLENLKKQRSLRRAPLSAALVALDAATGDVLVHVGGEVQDGGQTFDRARNARRQPGSVLKPLLLLEAFAACGKRSPLHPATRIADEALELRLPSGPWRPENSDGTFHGTIDVRGALRDSLNVPFVRIASWCGFEETAQRLRRAGIDLPIPAPPAFALGAVETSPLALAAAYTVFENGGRLSRPRTFTRLERPSGRRLQRQGEKSKRVVDAGSAFLVHHLLTDVVENGTAQNAALDHYSAAAKTGTSSEKRDAWLAGSANGIVTVVWIGRDDGKPLGLTGSRAAAPLWRSFMQQAVAIRPRRGYPPPEGLVERWVDQRTGLLVRSSNRHARKEWFRRGVVPRRDRFWRADPASPIIR